MKTTWAAACGALFVVGCIGACGGGHAGFTGGGGGSGGGDDAGCGLVGCSDSGSSDPCIQAGKPSTTLSGVVYDPAGKNPLYDVIVYVPAAPLKPFPSGVTCDKCGILESGSPIVSTLTDSSGKFVLENVPPGDDVPLVMQIGKWRKKITVSHVPACATTAMVDPTVMRLPSKQSEGDMPQLAIATGEADPFECLLRKIGVDDSEFADAGGKGKVHLYQGGGFSGAGSLGAQVSASTTPAQTFWADAQSLLKYDMVINACETSEHAEEKPQGSIDNLVAYANAGGRLFLTHYQYFWLDPEFKATGETSPWKPTASFIPESLPQDDNTETETVDDSFPKGKAFSQWLTNVGASTAPLQLPVTQPRNNAKGANAPALRWVYGKDMASGGDALMHYTFNTPWNAVSDQQCGKVLYSDFHVVATVDSFLPPTTATFPQECDSMPMTPQEKALEFMLFDLSACVQNDTLPPQPPVQ